ncbi:BED zinc finger family protein [Brugia malayi]|uniref:BED zinc finger family protein n=1 Tax=Brugia malayi TaxID=6279 RepID=A0A4E9F531_BRUMA|nr:BED zinc finger family protein [Brugia malayi]VIO91102.1 BED zinc finger family protein [Brugia malayi]
MISTKTMMKDEFIKASGLEYEDCDMDVENDDGSSVAGINETKGESESINDAGEEENDGGMASTSGNNLFRTQVFATQRHKPNREAKILETSIANLKKKLQTQSQTSFSASTTHSRLKKTSADTGFSSIREIEDLSQVTGRTALRIANEGRPLEVENCSDSFDEDGQTAVERSLAAMTKSKYSTSSRNPSNSGVDDNDDDDDNEGSKNDAFLDRIFGEGTDNNGSKNSDLYDINEAVETSNPGAYISSDMTLSAALRRKRQRRNPVWPYFIVKDGMATCKHCNYSTKSVFSTNLKVHLRTHHHDLFEEVLKAEEEQQEQISLQNSLLATCATTIAIAKTPYMHHVTTTALPAVGRCSNSGNNTANSNISNNTLSSTGSNLSSAAVLLGILNQTGGFQSGSVVTTTTTTTANITTISNRTRTLPTTSRSILDSSKAFSEPQLPLDYLKTTPDLTKSLPDFLKVISETSVKSVANAPLNQTKALVTGDNERLKTLNKISQNSPSSYNITYASGRTDKVTSPMGSQSAIVLKRRRLRRHPVWRFFKDVGDGSKTVKCVNCPFSTSSPFSTNLKMHLKAHHKSDYRLILILESRQRLEEGISPIPESVQTPSSTLKKSSSEDTNISSAEEEQAEEKKRSLSTGAFEDESFTSMTNTERVKAMIEMAAANQTQSLDLQYPNIDYAAIGNANRTVSFGSDETSSLVDTNLLMRLGLAKSDMVASKPPLQNKFLNAQSLVSGSTVRNHLVNAHISSALDTTKSVRTISKRLPTGEVVKVRQTRKSVENPMSNITATTSAAATATINTTKPIVPSRDLAATSRDLAATSTTDEQLNAVKSARDIALAKFLIKANAFQLLELPEFKQFVDVLDPTYQIPQSGYLKRLLESKTGTHDLSPEHQPDIVQEQGE